MWRDVHNLSNFTLEKSLNLEQQFNAFLPYFFDGWATDFQGYSFKHTAELSVSVPLYLQGHFGVGETFDPLNTTLPLHEALGVLPVNRVSVFKVVFIYL